MSKKLRIALAVLGEIIILMVVFGLGMTVGYRRALFEGQWGTNYYKNFYGGPPRGTVGIGVEPGPGPAAGHGAIGTVLDVGSSTVSVKDPENNEVSVAILPDTVVKDRDATVSSSIIKVGDQIAVIGRPNESGQVEAHFIRIFPASSTIEQPQ